MNIEQNDMVYRPLELQLVPVEKKVYDALLKNNCDLMDRVKTLEAENKSLKRKLKGVRFARKRDVEKAYQEVDWYIDRMSEFLEEVQPRNLKAKINYQSYFIGEIRDALLDSKKMTLYEFLKFEDEVNKTWKEHYERIR